MTNSINSLQGNLWKWLLIGFGSIVLVYGVMRAIPIMRGVTIHTYLPEDKDTTLNSFVLKGKAEHARKLTINGRDILIDPAGEFNDEVILASGINKIKIVAEDVRGNIHTKELVLMGKEITPSIKTARAVTEEMIFDTNTIENINN